MELRQQALLCLSITHPADKVSKVTALYQNFLSGDLSINLDGHIHLNVKIPGLPEKPTLVAPRDVERRSMNTPDGRGALIHSLCHIELNAINLALDAIWRFPNMPRNYYSDWLKVASEEAFHFSLLQNHLNKMGYTYGDFNAHASLWEMADRTQHDVLARMALVPRTFEARGLDATPQLRLKLAQVKDIEGAEILDVILKDEIGHVRTGNDWFNYLCNLNKLDPIETFIKLSREYQAPVPRKPFNHEARLNAGFTQKELDWLDEMGTPHQK
jgi:uncharacterized ferritin-like protein (DUF455 family)